MLLSLQNKIEEISKKFQNFKNCSENFEILYRYKIFIQFFKN